MEIKVESKVTWTHVRKSGKSFHMTTRTGRVKSIHGAGVVVVEYRGKSFIKSLSELRLIGQKTALTDFVKELAEVCA